MSRFHGLMAMESIHTPRMHHCGAFPIVALLCCSCVFSRAVGCWWFISTMPVQGEVTRAIQLIHDLAMQAKRAIKGK
jgi:hypothetical protein